MADDINLKTSLEPSSLEPSADNADIDCKSVFLKMINGFALHQIILDDNGTPVNYKYLDINPAFEKIIGLSRKDIVGRLVTEVLPGTENDPVDWIGKYGRVALTGEEAEFENYSTVLKKWFHISAYCPKKGFFVSLVEDITSRKQTEEDLKAKNADLEKIFNNIVGREAKMIDMKKQLNAMKEELDALKGVKKE